jgi:predicted transposase YbfD/YdcC
LKAAQTTTLLPCHPTTPFLAHSKGYFASALSAVAFAAAARGHWPIENKLYWVLDVTFGEDLSRLRAGHGAKKRWSATSPSIWSLQLRYLVKLD